MSHVREQRLALLWKNNQNRCVILEFKLPFVALNFGFGRKNYDDNVGPLSLLEYQIK